MFVLLLVAGIPVVSIAVTNALQDYRGALEDGRRGVDALRTLMAVRYGAALAAPEAVFGALAREAPPTGDCTASLRRVIELHPGDIAELAVVTPDAVPLCGTLRPGFDPRPLLREALASGTSAYGAFLAGGGGRAPVLPIAVPGTAGGAWAVVGTTVLRDYPAEADGGRRVGDSVWLLDREDRIIATGSTGATRPDPALLIRVAESGETVEGPQGTGLAGTRLNPGLRLVVGRPVGPAREVARSILLQRITELAAFLIACLTAIVVGADLAMVRPLRLLSARVRTWRPGNAFRVSPAGTEPIEVRAVEQAFSEAAGALARREADLRAALERHDALMAEIHHRVKNNLQIVSSLLNLQAGRLSDPAAAEEFLAARNRVRALATLHRHLYLQHAVEAIALPPFLAELVNQQFTSHDEAPGERIALRLEVADIAISTDQAVSLTLFVTEALGNALEHAFPDDQRGTVRLVLALAEGEAGSAVLTVQDDGIGIPERKDRPRGLGLQLMEGFAKQIGGSLAGGPIPPEEGGGTRWTVRFPVRENAAPRSLAR